MKIKSLAAEAGIIRFEEARAPSSYDRATLRQHRIEDVRQEQRSSLLAYGYIRGKAYCELEANARTAPSHKRVAQLVKTFGPWGVSQKISDGVQSWLQARDPDWKGPRSNDPADTTGSNPVTRSMSG